jgi:hypothetical protein
MSVGVMTPIDFIVTGIGFTTVGGIGLAVVARAIARGAQSRNWAEFDGEIVASDTETWRTWDRGIPIRWVAPPVSYRYPVGGKQLVSDRVFFGGPHTLPFLRRPVAHIVERYPQGRAVKVRVSPTDPHLCVLEPGATWYSYVAGAGMAGFWAAGLLTLRTLFR